MGHRKKGDESSCLEGIQIELDSEPNRRSIEGRGEMRTVLTRAPENEAIPSYLVSWLWHRLCSQECGSGDEELGWNDKNTVAYQIGCQENERLYEPRCSPHASRKALTARRQSRPSARTKCRCPLGRRGFGSIGGNHLLHTSGEIRISQSFAMITKSTD